MLQKSISRMSEDSERWCDQTCKLHGRRKELTVVHQVQSAAQTVIGELQTCPSAFSYLAVLSEIVIKPPTCLESQACLGPCKTH